MSKTQAEKRIFKAAESLSDEIYRQSETLIQPEDLTCWIRCHMELRPEEQEEEFEGVESKLSQSRNESPAKSVANELRQALGKPDMSLFDLLHEAVHAVKQRNEILRSNQELSQVFKSVVERSHR